MLDAERLALANRQHASLDLVTLAKSAVAEVAPLAMAAGYTIAFASETDPVIVRANSHAVTRALLNLLGNAIAHGGNAGSIEVRVFEDRVVEISDEGPGVPDEARQRIFEPFRRERWDKDGCGLGLHLVREIMRAHHGDVRLVDCGRGAAFQLRFDIVA